MSSKQAYQRPRLRKVQLLIKTSVLAVCNTSTVNTPKNQLGGCKTVPCHTS